MSVLVATVMFLSIAVPAYTADKATFDSIAISSFTDTIGSININAGKAEGVKPGMRGVIIRDGKQIAEYQVAQVNWAISRIMIANLADGYTVQPGDNAPITTPITPKKSSAGKIWKALGIAAAVALVWLLVKGDKGDSGGAADNSAITLTAQKTSTGDDSIVITITANIKDASGETAPDGTSVTFSTTAGTLNRTQTITFSGKATATLTADTEDDDVATVTVKSLGKTATIDVSFVSSIELAASPTSIQVAGSGGTQTESTITATCRDAAGNLATSGTVEFTAGIGTVTDSATIVGGVATATFTSDEIGVANVTASWSKSTVMTTVTVTAGPPYSVVVTSSTSSLQCDGNSFATISATVSDFAGNPATDGTVVDFSVTPDGGGGGNGTITPQGTTVAGVASASLFTKDSTGAVSQPGTATVVVEVLAASQPATVPAPLSDIENQSTHVQFVSIEVAGINLGANPTNIRGWDMVNNTTTITAVVYNAAHNPVPDGTAVYFTASHGMIYGSGGGSVGMSTTTNGVATATLSTDASGDGTWDGLVDVTATSGTVTATQVGLVIFSGPPSPGNCDATISQSTLASVGGQATISVTALDVNANPVADGTSVTATTDKGNISPGTKSTADGTAVFILSTSTNPASPTQSGDGTVTISIDSGGKNAETGGLPVTLTVPFTVSP